MGSAVGGLHPELPGWTEQLAVAIAAPGNTGDIWLDRSDRIAVADDSPGRQHTRWSKLLIVFAACFGLGAAGVLAAHHFLKSDNLSSPPPVQIVNPPVGTSNTNPGYHPVIHPTIVRKPDHAAPAHMPAAAKPRPPTKMAHPKPVHAIAPPAPSVSTYVPPAPPPAASAANPPVEAPLTPVPETKPTTIDGWVLREVVNGTAVLEGPDGIFRVKRGDTVPGVGQVVGIFGWGNRMIVATSRGLISTP
jgi:hypothetical protein